MDIKSEDRVLEPVDPVNFGTISTREEAEATNAAKRKDAIYDYRRRGARLFSPPDADGRMPIEALSERLCDLSERLEREDCPSVPFSADDCELMAQSVRLGRRIVYIGYFPSGVGGLFLPMRCRESCPDTRRQNGLEARLHELCVQAVRLCRKCGSDAEAAFMSALSLLNEFREWRGYGKIAGDSPIYGARTALEKIRSGFAVLKASLDVWEADHPRLPLGIYARGFVVSCRSDTGLVTFRSGERLTVPPDMTAWQAVKKLLQSPEPDGRALLDKDWDKNFRILKTRPNADLPAMRRHIVRVGRGIGEWFHLVEEPVPPRRS